MLGRGGLSMVVVIGMACGAQAFAAAEGSGKLHYPPTRRVSQVDDYHGVRVADPYRWLEDDRSEETAAWVRAQNELTFGYLRQIPERDAIRRRLTDVWNFERTTPPVHHGGRWFFARNSGLENQSVWYWTDALDAAPRVLVDPNRLSKDGTVALTALDVTDDGKLAAYGVSAAGSDWQEWHFREVATGRDLPDVLRWVKFSDASWTKDGKGVYYSRYDEPAPGAELTATNYFQKLYYHRLGTPQSEDVLVYGRPDDKELEFGGRVSDDGRYLVIVVTRGTEQNNGLYYQDLAQAGAPVVRLLDRFDAEYAPIENVGSTLYVRTDLDAPRGRIVAIDLAHPERSRWKTVVPQADDTLEDASLVGGRLVARYLHDAHSVVRVYGLGGELAREVSLPGIGTAAGFEGRPGDPETFYSFTSFTSPAVVYRFDVRTGKSTVFSAPELRFDPSSYETEQVFYHSKDGTRVPMFLVHKKGIVLDGKNPTYLYGYGGFDISLTPTFSPANLVWMEMGGVYAQATLRGGGEYGQAWHDAGRKLHKQNVFDDFIAAAEWLVSHHYTSPAKLAIGGRSNGGLLVGAVLDQRPDLFGAAIPGVGVMDMLRFHKFTIGWGWVSDYGCSDDPEQFRALYAYSPLHNIHPGTRYPAVLVTTADHDDRVVPAHSFKYAATLQAAQAGDAPVLIRIETRAGHGGGKPTSKLIDEVADGWSFLVKNLHMSPELATAAARRGGKS